MQAQERPLSPYWIYRWEITMWLSSLHRISGLFLSLGAVVLAVWLIALASGPEAFDGVQAVVGAPWFKVLLVGWTLAFFYHLVPAARNSRLATIHFWLAAVSSVVMLVTLYMLYGGNASVEPVLGVASLVYFAATILFAYIALSALWRSESASAADRVPAE